MTTKAPTKTFFTLAATAMALFGLSAPAAHALAIVIPPANVSSSSEIPTPFNRQDDFLVDGSGLTGTAHDVSPTGQMWLSTGDGFGGEDLDPWVMFDLGAVYTINSFHVWNYNETQPNLQLRGVNGVAVEYGTTAGLGSTVPGISNFSVATGLNTYTGENFSTFTPFNAQYIKFDINSNHGGDNNFYGLSEVQFDGDLVSAVPEPATSLPILVLGIAGVIGFRRRRMQPKAN